MIAYKVQTEHLPAQQIVVGKEPWGLVGPDPWGRKGCPTGRLGPLRGKSVAPGALHNRGSGHLL